MSNPSVSLTLLPASTQPPCKVAVVINLQLRFGDDTSSRVDLSHVAIPLGHITQVRGASNLCPCTLDSREPLVEHAHAFNTFRYNVLSATKTVEGIFKVN